MKQRRTVEISWEEAYHTLVLDYVKQYEEREEFLRKFDLLLSTYAAVVLGGDIETARQLRDDMVAELAK